MRPLRLDLDGFTVFREPTTIDFSDADFFALVGPTGSGKSTVLDAICFALYGTVPRWGDKRAIANALAPSATEARVRLVFESAGARYVLTRVVRRDGKGAVNTRQAGLEALPAGFDLSRFDAGLSDADLGAVLAGTASEVDAGVSEVIGLPYEQFTKCVVLPQGEFAAFLHAKPADRQKILVNLLGLEVYGRLRERAGALANEADAQLAATDGLLAGYADADDTALAVAAERVAVLRTLAEEIDRVGPQLADAQRAAALARQTLTDLDAELAQLAAVRAPSTVDVVGAVVTRARTAAHQAAEAVIEAEEREEKLRAQLADGPDLVELRRLLDAYGERGRLASEAAVLADTLSAAQAEHDVAGQALQAARDYAAEASAQLEAAREAYQLAAATDKAAALRAHLRVGDACPVCTQTVAALPRGRHRSAVAAAEAAGATARTAAETATKVVEDRDRAFRELDRALAAARARADHIGSRLSELDIRLAGAPAAEAIKAEIAACAARERDLEESAAELRRSREAHRVASAAVQRAERDLRTAWREFDTVRDAVARFGPPAAERDDLPVAWAALQEWAQALRQQRRVARDAAVEVVGSADAAVEDIAGGIALLFETAGLPAPEAEHSRVAAVALERAEAAHRRVEERRAQAARLRDQRAEHERAGRVARTLAGHLRADRFERWLLAEALDALVDGASGILRELSGGQYDLGHDKGEFFVVDHHDAGLRRPVRTLSGGETFQASLALALALSEQLAGMSRATASLESILLDEGFGTLDPSTLDTVAATLENLAARGDRVVGVVTHVAALAERIPVRFEVRRDARSARVQRLSS